MITRKSLVGAAIVFILAGVALAAPPTTIYDHLGNPIQLDLTQAVKLGMLTRVADKYGDWITVESVRGPSNRINPDYWYEVKGAYRLVSADEAAITTGETGCASKYTTTSWGRIVHVARGEGHFKIYFHNPRGGNPGVIFRPFVHSDLALYLYFQTEPAPLDPASCTDKRRDKPQAYVMDYTSGGSRQARKLP